MPMNTMEILTLFLVIFAALTYLDNRLIRNSIPTPRKVWMLFLIVLQIQRASDFVSDTFLTLIIHKRACLYKPSFYGKVHPSPS